MLRQVDFRKAERLAKRIVRSATRFTYYRWRKGFSGLKGDQAKQLERSRKIETPCCKAVSDLTLDKLILKEAASRNF